MTMLVLLCGGSSWGLHALSLSWLWALPLGILGGFLLFCIGLAFEARSRHGCEQLPPFPRSDSDPRIPRIPDSPPPGRPGP